MSEVAARDEIGCAWHATTAFWVPCVTTQFGQHADLLNALQSSLSSNLYLGRSTDGP